MAQDIRPPGSHAREWPVSQGGRVPAGPEKDSSGAFPPLLGELPEKTQCSGLFPGQGLVPLGQPEPGPGWHLPAWPTGLGLGALAGSLTVWLRCHGVAGPRCSGRCPPFVLGERRAGHPVSDDLIFQISPVTQPPRPDQTLIHLAQTNFKAIHYLTSSVASAFADSMCIKSFGLTLESQEPDPSVRTALGSPGPPLVFDNDRPSAILWMPE